MRKKQRNKKHLKIIEKNIVEFDEQTRRGKRDIPKKKEKRDWKIQ